MLNNKFIVFYVACLIVLSIVSACSPSDTPKYIDSKFEEVELLVKHNPDSALLILDSLQHLNTLDEEQQNKCFLLNIQAKDKTFADITQDTAIFITAKYYLNKKDYKNASQAYYYSGRLCHENKNNNDAMHYYLDAESLSESIADNDNLKGAIQANIAYLLFYQFEFTDALLSFFKALHFFEQCNNQANQIYTLSDVGNCFLMLNQPDSAFIYYDKSLALADKSEQPYLKLNALRNLGSVQINLGNYDDALQFYKQVLSIANDPISTIS